MPVLDDFQLDNFQLDGFRMSQVTTLGVMSRPTSPLTTQKPSFHTNKHFFKLKSLKYRN